MTSEDILRITTDELEKVLSPSHIMGAAVTFEDKTVIPVVKFGFGFGAGGGKGDAGERGGEGEGGGGGGGISPVALVVLHKDVKGIEGIQVISLQKEGPVAQAISAVSESLVPQVIEAIKTMKGKKEKPGKEAESS